MRLAASRTFCTAGSKRPIRTAMIAITTRISISVKPRRGAVFRSVGMVATFLSGIKGCGTDRNRPALDSLAVRLFIQFRHVPDFYSVVAAARDQEAAVGAECHAVDDVGVTAESAEQLSGVAVPDLDLAVLTPGGDPSALGVGAERHRVDLFAVPSEGGQKLLALLHVPNQECVIIAPRRQPFAVRAEGDVHTRTGNPHAKDVASWRLLC